MSDREDEVRRIAVTIDESEIAGLIDTPGQRAACSWGWKAGWDNGWHVITRLRVWWHTRNRNAVVRSFWDPS